MLIRTQMVMVSLIVKNFMVHTSVLIYMLLVLIYFF